MDLTSDLCPSTTLTPPTHTAPSLHLYFSLSNLRTREETKRFIIIILYHPTHTTHHRPSTSDHLPQTPIIDHPLKTIYPQSPTPNRPAHTRLSPQTTYLRSLKPKSQTRPQTTHHRPPTPNSLFRPARPDHPFLATHFCPPIPNHHHRPPPKATQHTPLITDHPLQTPTTDHPTQTTNRSQNREQV